MMKKCLSSSILLLFIIITLSGCGTNVYRTDSKRIVMKLIHKEEDNTYQEFSDERYINKFEYDNKVYMIRNRDIYKFFEIDDSIDMIITYKYDEADEYIGYELKYPAE